MKVWIFKNKKTDTIKVYGNLRLMSSSEEVVISEKVLNENALRYLLLPKKYEDDNYRIEQVEVLKGKKIN